MGIKKPRISSLDRKARKRGKPYEQESLEDRLKRETIKAERLNKEIEAVRAGLQSRLDAIATDHGKTDASTPPMSEEAALEKAVGRPESREDLYKAAFGGDAVAKKRLWDDCRRWIASVLLAYAPRDADIPRLLNRVHLKYLEGTKTTEPPADFTAWFRRIAMDSIAEVHAPSLRKPTKMRYGIGMRPPPTQTPLESLESMRTRLVRTPTQDDIRLLEEHLIRAQQVPPTDRAKFVQEINELFDIFSLRIRTDDGDVGRLSLDRNDVLCITRTGSRGTRGFKNTTIRLVPVPRIRVGNRFTTPDPNPEP